MSVVFANRWVLVTGASSGLGEEIAKRLAQRGAHLVLSARREERLKNLAADLTRVNGTRAEVIAADLSEPDGAERLLSAVRERELHISHLVNNAGFGSAGAFAELDPA